MKKEARSAGRVMRVLVGSAAIIVAIAGHGRMVAADMVVEQWCAGDEGPHPRSLRITEAGGGATVIRADMSALPKDTEIHRARLLVRRSALDPATSDVLVGGVAIPLASDFRPGMRRRMIARPLEIPGPWFEHFEATELVRQWIRGERGSHGFVVRSLPGWRKEQTRLEIAYEGRPEKVPPQVSGVKAFHRAGQTFVTWNEIDPLVTADETTWGEIRRKLAEAGDACVYRIYSHTKPINAQTIAAATLLAEVGPLSGYNCNGRNVEYLIGQAMLQPDETGELARDYNGYIYSWHVDHPRMDRYPVPRLVIDEKTGSLPVGTGLYVHHPTSNGRRYYAVTCCRGGVENARDFSAQNAVAEPIAESVGPGRPVLQGDGLWGPYFDYPGRRKVYTQWCAPPLSPRPNMYFNWSVLVPPDVEADRRVPLELYLHTGNFTYAKPRTKFMRDSIQIAPHDYPFSGWYGYNEAFGTLKPWRGAVVCNHTQKRIMSFLEWAKKEFPIDPDRVILCGADGAAMLAMNHRDAFAYVLIKGFEGSGELQGRILDPKNTGRFASAWGPKHADIQDENGRGEWGWAMLDRLTAEQPDRDMPLIVCEGKSWGGVRKYGKGFGRYYTAMQEARQPLIAGFGWDKKLVPPDWYTSLWRGLDITRTTPIPAFANSSGTREGLQHANVNWDHYWEDVRDDPDRFQITLWGADKGDVTLRRIQNFKVRPGERLQWQAQPRPGPTEARTLPRSEGVVTAASDGLVTVRGLETGRNGVILRIARAP